MARDFTPPAGDGRLRVMAKRWSPVSRRRFLSGAVAALVAARPQSLSSQSRQSQPLTRVAFGSCADQGAPQPIWEAVLAYRPELFIFAGDNVYGDVSSGDLVELRQAYATAREIPGMNRLRASVPHLATWDDHDYGENDGGADFPWRRKSQRQFAEFWDLAPGDPRRMREGVYHAATFGPVDRRVQVILLDTRYFRSPLKPSDQRGAPGKERYVPDDDPAKTILGAAQWQWLEERLAEPAQIRLIVSSIQVLAEGHGWERWGNLPRERRRLFDLIARTKAEGVVFLSGDRHVGALYEETGDVPYPLIEITSSGINKFFAAASEAGPNRLGALYPLPNFGIVDIDWWSDEISLAVADIAGQPRRRATRRISSLRQA